MTPGPFIAQTVPADLLRRANHGREILQPDGHFRIAPHFKHVWIDVGAHYLESSRPYLANSPDTLLIGVEPQAECWSKWPDADWLIAMPVALFIERGSMDFHVNSSDVTSSLAESEHTGTALDAMMKTVEVRSVPVLRLDDLLDAIPEQMDVDFVQIDVQGVDLQVVKSAGPQLRRVRHVQVEVDRIPLYKEVKGERAATEEETIAYMNQMGFEFLRDLHIEEQRRWLHKQFVNVECRGSWWTRLRHRVFPRH